MSQKLPAESVKSAASGTRPTEPLYQIKLLSALRSGDPALIHPFLTEIGKDRRHSNDGDLDTGAAALHLAVRCGTVETVALLLSHRAISPNGIHPPGSGTTPLHLAASLGRVDIVNLLLEQNSINDTLRDNQGRTCKDVARGKEVIKAIDDSHSFLNASYRSLLHSYIHSPPSEPPSPALLAMLDSPRIRFVNLSYLDDDSGTSLLHEAAKRKDLRLIELAVRAGADVFVRNRRGKMAGEGAPKDDRVRVFLRQFANRDTTLIETPTSEPPTLKGYLNKYTNVAKGYNTRWFVLKNGILSYYRHQEDETVASRGSISMKTALLKPSATDRLRFEVHSTPSKGHHSVQKWYMRANHHVEASRWTQAIGKSIEWYKREGAMTDGESAGGSPSLGRRTSVESAESGMKSVKSTHSQYNRFSATLMRKGGKAATGSDRESTASSKVDLTGSSVAPMSGDASPNMSLLDEGWGSRSRKSASGGDDDDADVEDELQADSSSSESSSKVPPHEDGFELQGNSAAAQMELTAQLLTNVAATSPSEVELKRALTESFSMAQGMVNEYIDMVRTREAWWKRKLHKERKQQKFWEDSLATVVREGETLERELRARSRRRGSKFFDVSADGTLRQRPSLLGIPSTATVKEGGGVSQEYFPIQSPEPMIEAEMPQEPKVTPTRKETQETVSSVSTVSPTRTPIRTPTATRIPISTKFSQEFEEAVDTDEEDEFFDAIESGNIPNLIVSEALVTPASEMRVLKFDTAPYSGYMKLRTQLEHYRERPSTSLWSVLKHSIGKDLTRISFPVFFNEPTSMLQRMAEDMEFSECLDAAVREKDPLRRLAFVAAFAMSNYSSTIGRIAKPFNPMLSETFEYVRFDKEFRYVSEQVSHHPPISACWAESPAWHYYGEVDAQNRFMGKSFEIRPTGVAHAELIIPADRAEPGYPEAPSKYGEGKVVEHYSWKKVTTNVSGFILGSPTIDHYGDMIVTNHRTEDQCILTFKPRGWRGKDAYEIAGQVIDSSGSIAYEIAGRWNSQLIATPYNGGFALNPDLQIHTAASPGASSQPHFLLWRNTEKPVGSPFNLTPFAITLNDCPEDTLKPFLCPTDCRLRPDQRAFEMGQYELANDLKNAQEEKQRAIRKAREEGTMPPHRPRWFMAETDGDTGERVWTPSRVGGTLEYWVEREKVWREREKAEWKDVDHIFIDAPDSIR
ncbi:Oxysterol-binding C2F12.05c [Hypsizygus marmoreus]|uniref:Oxysterol-binding C2F12.05c n=1 Tax=Hypsizygus marmoreus TaxID=39966 RepID=A0A369KEJ7_HYPMA|nr:Oxysterol-binding C2F12.05c [Hypsizygus marmoreus]